MKSHLERQLTLFDSRSQNGDIHEMEIIAAQLRTSSDENIQRHVQKRTKLAYERRLEENLRHLRTPADLEGFSIHMLADEVRLCADRLGRVAPEELASLEREGYRAAAEHYVSSALSESSRQAQTRLKSFARHFAKLAGPFCALEIDAALGER